MDTTPNNPPLTFTQNETLRGVIERIDTRLNTITFKLTNKDVITLELSPNQIISLATADTSKFIYDFHGRADYEYANNFQVKLIHFVVYDFDPIPAEESHF